MLVTMSAFVMSGKTVIPRFCMAITYGDAAAVPVLPLLRRSLSFGSLEGNT
jgi:hypothetical protein